MQRTTKLNDAQLRLIQLFEFASTPKEEKELMKVLQDYYVRKFMQARERVLSTGKFDEDTVDKYVKTHQHGKAIQ